MNQNEDSKKPIVKSINHGDVEVENAINLLVRDGYLLVGYIASHNWIRVSDKLTRFYNEKMSNPQLPQNTSIQSIKEEKITIQDFKVKAEIPFRIKTATFQFTANAISLEAERYFNKNVVGKCNMDLLIQLTRAFYKDESVARPTLSNYFLSGVWEGVLSDYKPKNQIQVVNQSFTGDRKL